MFFLEKKFHFNFKNVFCLVALVLSLNSLVGFASPDKELNSDPTSKTARLALFSQFDDFVRTVSDDPDFRVYQDYLSNFSDEWGEGITPRNRPYYLEAPLFLAPVNKKFLKALKEFEQKFKVAFPKELDESGNWYDDSPFRGAFEPGNSWTRVAVEVPGVADGYYFTTKYVSWPKRVSGLKNRALSKVRSCMVNLRTLFRDFWEYFE